MGARLRAAALRQRQCLVEDFEEIREALGLISSEAGT
jgi:hypothetical protein